MVLGNNSTVAAANTNYYNPGSGTLSGTASGVVSVGTAGAEREITNVAPGSNATDAVNVSQLQSLASAVAAGQTHYYSVNDGGAQGGNYANDGATGADALAAGVGASAAGASGVAIGSGASASTTGTVSIGQNAGANATSVSDVNIGNDAGANAAGGQNTAIGPGAGNGVNGTLNTSIGSLSGESVQGNYNSNIGSQAGALTVGNANANFGLNAGVQVTGNTNVGIGAAAGAGVTGNGNVSIGAGANAASYSVDATTGQVTSTGTAGLAVSNTVALGTGAIANNNGDVALGAGSTTAAANPTSGATITTASGGQLTLSGFAGANPTSVVSVGAPGAERQITNVAAGRVTATSTDAVNGSQLYAVASEVDTAVNGGGIKYFHANSTAADSNAVGTDSIAVGPTATANGDSSIAEGSGAVAGVSGNQAVSGDVALGSGAQATGGNSLALGNGASVATLGGVALGAGSVADRAAGTYVDPISGSSFTTTLGAVSVGASGALRQITNVAPGTQLTDAVNLGQLESAISTLDQTINSLPAQTVVPSTGGDQTWITGNPTTFTPPSASGQNATAAGSGSVASGSGSTALGDHATASGANSVALGANSVATAANTVSVGSVGNERTISNLAPGVNGTDAVNVNQLNSGVSNAVAQANQYTNQQIEGLKNDMNSGVAAAMAVAGLPQPTGPGKSMVAVAGSTWQGQQGLALGVSTVSENGKWIYKGALTTSSRGGTGAVLGAGYQW
ncbi:hypothetical protein LMG30113_05809 [Burkholderia paludis]|nr:hypothetical protein LMG30113_05809 [Burkholderia paludis]